jgi:excisionase family DNA binding protein
MTAPASLPHNLITTTEAARRLGITPRTLNMWRTTERYALPYVKVGRCVRYSEEAIGSFIAERTKGGRHG